MLLAVDVGNSQTSFGAFDSGKLKFHWRAETNYSRTADEYVSLFFPWLDAAGLKGTKWEAVALCSVVPPVDAALETFARQYLGSPFFKIHRELNFGFEINVVAPAEVGADRLVNAAFAVNFLKLPAVVVDFGTATTFDVVSAGRKYEGGIILPGLRLNAEALSTKTAKLPLIDLKFPKFVVGKTTVDCIQSGILYGYCDMIDGLIRRIEAEVGACDVALTGGLSSLFHDRLQCKPAMLPNLTLDAIAMLYQRNK